ALFVTVRDDEGAEHGRRALDAHARADYGLPLEELEQIQAVVTRSGAQVREGLAQYVAAGARHLVCRPAAVGLRTLGDRVERVADLIPLLHAP
ncbi:MAG: LLM class flavin-dependent oxidoreductase, partial [Nonomuraea sp.]|nr:LLM class flavin-dependent oxidoreductase [Nonomuraea sp.]